MLDKTSEQVGRIVDGKMVCAVGKNKDLFSDKTPEEVQALKDLSDIRERHRDLMSKHILGTFREAVKEFEATYGAKPTRILMNYRDVGTLCTAYNKELREATAVDGLFRESQSEYSSSIKIDGMTVKKGCDQEPGELRFYAFE